MKKILLSVMILTLCFYLFGCSAKSNASQPPPEAGDPSQPSVTTPVIPDGREMMTDSGTYVGQADSNFIEIKISGVPEEKASRVFMLSPELKEGFEDLGLDTGDQIKFDYYVNENKVNVILSIKTE